MTRRQTNYKPSPEQMVAQFIWRTYLPSGLEELNK